MSKERIAELEAGIRYGNRIRHKCNVEGEINRMEKELIKIKKRDVLVGEGVTNG